MGIYIDRINLQNYGPLGNRELDFGKLNLIYGLNESGKTFLTEFILQSVFKYPSASKWQMRNVPGQGKVILSGLERGPVEFSPKIKRKIEDYWVESAPGLPTNMARLLFVKGGELTLISTENESNKHFLKSVLSQEVLIERILKKIKRTIQKAQIVDRNIDGESRGDIGNRNKIKEQLLGIDRLLEDIEENYSWGRLFEKRQELEALIEKMKVQEKAKRYYAFTLNDEINKTQTKIISEDVLEMLRDDLKEYARVKGEIQSLKNRIEEERSIVDNYSFLDQAVSTWESLGLESNQKPALFWQIAAIIMFLFGLVCSLIQLFLLILESNNGWIWLLPAFSIVFILFGISFTILYLIKLNKWEKTILNSSEREAIKAEYKDRFRKSIRGLTDLRTDRENLRDKNIELTSLPSKITELEGSNQARFIKIDRVLSTLNPDCVDSSEWEKCLLEIKKSQDTYKDRLEKNKIRLAALNVDEENYLTNPAEEEYNHDQSSRYVEDKNSIQEEIAHIESELDRLKVRAYQETQDKLDTDWLEVLNNIRVKREDLLKEYKQITAKIVGEIATKEVLFTIQKEEDEKINRGLQTKELSDILKIVTGRYESIDLSDDKLLIRGAVENFYLDELSTGAREQILLALRMAFASKLAGGEPLFMILDDAFQHTDWERREQLFEAVFRLVDAGWQMTYLTMSDQIRDRFIELGRKRLGNEFVFYPLA